MSNSECTNEFHSLCVILFCFLSVDVLKFREKVIFYVSTIYYKLSDNAPQLPTFGHSSALIYIMFIHFVVLV